MRRGRQAKLRAGTLLPWTTAPFGYRLDPERPRRADAVRVEPGEAALVAQLFDWYLEPQATVYRLARRLTDLEVPTPRGGPRWNTASVRGILRNPSYAGRALSNRTQVAPARGRKSAMLPAGPGISHAPRPEEDWIAVPVPPIVSEEAFAQVQAKLDANQQGAARNTRHEYLLRALISCGACRLGCTGRQTAAGYRYYLCRGRTDPLRVAQGQRCTARYIPAGQLDELVWADLCALLTDPAQVTRALARAQGGAWLPQELHARQATIGQALGQLERQQQRLLDAYLAEVVTLPELDRKRQDLDRRRATLLAQQRQLDAAARQKLELGAVADGIEAFCQTIRAGLATATFAQRRLLAELLIDRVVVTDGQVEIRYVLPTSPDGPHRPFCQLRKDHLDELPGSLAKLARRQALELSPARFDADTRRLLRVLDRTIAQAKERARQDAEAEAERRRRVGQLQQRIRDRAAARDWDAVVAAGGELSALDPAAADPDGLVGVAREQIARHQEAERPTVGAQQPGDDLLTSRGDSPRPNAGPQGLTPAGQAVAEPDADLAPSPGVVDRRAASEAGSDDLRLSAREETPHPAAPAPSDPASVDEPWWAAAPAMAEATSQPAGKPETVGVSGRPPRELDTSAADADEPDSTAAVHAARAARFPFSIDWARLAQQLRRRIVIVPLAALLLVVVIGGFIAWQWSQSQYYVGTNSRGEVTIYRGVNQQIAGISLSSPYQATGIQLAQVPTPYQQTLQATDAAGSLNEAQAIVANVRSAVTACRQQYLARKAWVAEENAYQQALAQARSEHKSTSGIPKPGPQPAITGSCPPSTAFGIAASDLVPAGSS